MRSTERQVDMFLDYNNVDRRVRDKGSAHVIHRVLEQLPVHGLLKGARVVTRVYGGWYDHQRMTVAGQKVHDDLGNSFPSVVSLATSGGESEVQVSAELARALVVSPEADLLNTYRSRGAPRNLRVKEYPFARCVSPPSACPLGGAHHLVNTGKCPEPGCPVRLRDVVTRAEQKLVDSMLTADLVYAATLGHSPVIIVSSDDDMWPAIHTAVSLGTTVHHVHPVRGRRTPDIYAATVSGNYFQYSF